MGSLEKHVFVHSPFVFQLQTWKISPTLPCFSSFRRAEAFLHVAPPRKAIRKKGAEIAHSSAEFFHHGTEVDS